MEYSITVAELNALITERNNLISWVKVFDPSSPLPSLDSTGAVDPHVGEIVLPPHCWITAGPDGSSYGDRRAQISYPISEKISEAFRLDVLDEWRARVQEIDTRLAAVRGVFP